MTDFEYLISMSQNEAFRKFVEANIQSGDISSLRMKYAGKDMEGIDLDFALAQIAGKKHIKKFPSFASTPQWLFPHPLASEQASDELVASLHAEWIPENSTVADLTGGLGIDALSLAKRSSSTHIVEKDALTAAVLRHNSEALNIKNVSVICADSMQWLKDEDDIFDVIFVDPARRGDCNSRKYSFHDCTPDILENMKLLLSKGKKIIIKASPMLDVKAVLKEIPEAKEIVSVALRGEMKELAIIIDPLSSDSLRMTAVNILDSSRIEKFMMESVSDGWNLQLGADYYSEDMKPGMYLYEPNSAIMKLAPWDELGRRFPMLKKIDVNTHLYIGTELEVDFPGKIFRITGKLNKRDEDLRKNQWNVICRNYPLSPEQVLKKYKLRHGSDYNYIIGLKSNRGYGLFTAEQLKKVTIQRRPTCIPHLI